MVLQPSQLVFYLSPLSVPTTLGREIGLWLFSFDFFRDLLLWKRRIGHQKYTALIKDHIVCLRTIFIIQLLLLLFPPKKWRKHIFLPPSLFSSSLTLMAVGHWREKAREEKDMEKKVNSWEIPIDLIPSAAAAILLCLKNAIPEIYTHFSSSSYGKKRGGTFFLFPFLQTFAAPLITEWLSGSVQILKALKSLLRVHLCSSSHSRNLKNTGGCVQRKCCDDPKGRFCVDVLRKLFFLSLEVKARRTYLGETEQ